MAKLYIKNKYAVIPNNILNDQRISFRAKGIWAFLQSKPDGWKFSDERIAKQSKEGEKAVRSALKELEKYGYLKRVKRRKQNGKFDGYDYILTEGKEEKNEEKTTTVGLETVGRFSAGGFSAGRFSADISKKDVVKKDIAIHINSHSDSKNHATQQEEEQQTNDEDYTNEERKEIIKRWEETFKTKFPIAIKGKKIEAADYMLYAKERGTIKNIKFPVQYLKRLATGTIKPFPKLRKKDRTKRELITHKKDNKTLQELEEMIKQVAGKMTIPYQEQNNMYEQGQK